MRTLFMDEIKLLSKICREIELDKLDNDNPNYRAVYLLTNIHKSKDTLIKLISSYKSMNYKQVDKLEFDEVIEIITDMFNHMPKQFYKWKVSEYQ